MTINFIIDADNIITSIKVLLSGEILLGSLPLIIIGLASASVSRWDMAGEFRGLIQTSACHVHSLESFSLAGNEILIAASAGKVVDMYNNFCPFLMLIANHC